MASRSYNSVGAGETPKLGNHDSVIDLACPGGPQTAASVTISTDLPKAARPGSRQEVKRGSDPMTDVARPGGGQTAHAPSPSKPSRPVD
jgi:hypothetical protein